MQNQISSSRTLFTISEFSAKKLDQFAIATQKTFKNISQDKDLATYSLQNSLNCLYIRRIYVAFRSIKNYGFIPFRMNSQSSVISGRSEKSEVQSMRNLLLKLKNDPRQNFSKKKQTCSSIQKAQSIKQNRKKLLNSIVQKLRNGRHELSRDNKFQIYQRPKYKSNTPEYNNSTDLLSNRKSTTITKLHIPQEEAIHQSQYLYLHQQKQDLTKLLIKEVQQLKKQLFDAKKTTAMLIEKQNQQERLYQHNRKNAQSLSQYRILTTPRNGNDQFLSSARYERKPIQISQLQPNSHKNKSISQNNDQVSKPQPQVVINHHVHNYYSNHNYSQKPKNQIGNSIKPFKNKILTELSQTAKKTTKNDDNDRSKCSTYREYGDRIKVTITQNILNSQAKATHHKYNFSKAIRSRCTGLLQPEISKNSRPQQSA